MRKAWKAQMLSVTFQRDLYYSFPLFIHLSFTEHPLNACVLLGTWKNSDFRVHRQEMCSGITATSDPKGDTALVRDT